ncbi:MAG: BMP family ABC transporter substrate-binding protein [Lachnospiraceae bacterium]|nr:BMP family ABC transporter substrate-binding protein [Lachnospiraceae bacterium]
MALYDYSRALKAGKKRYQASLSKGEHPYLPVLDDILSYTDIVSEVDIGLVDIPLSRIVGTKTQGRTNAFAGNFMPLMEEHTEFAAKWAALFDHQAEEGIHDPIVAYEFMNKYYVMEGNKRVSVLKYVGAFSIMGTVTRLLPRRSEEKENKLYYEFLDFYQVSFNCDVWFSKEGSYKRLIDAMGLEPDQVWDDDTRSYFKAVYDRFTKVFEGRGGNALGLTCSDAFLIYVEIFDYETIKERTEGQIQKDLDKIWQELTLKAKGGHVALVEQPEEVRQPSGLMKLLSPGKEDHLKRAKASSRRGDGASGIAFIYEKTPETSSWTYGHELGRLYLEEALGGDRTILRYDGADTDARAEEAILEAIREGCQIIFTTTPRMIQASVKAAVQYPQVKILNCNVNTSYSSVRTYYGRMYEAKFLMGAIAAAMARLDDLGYIADYPIYGSLANVNAFAMGARMIDPRSRIHLKWKSAKDRNGLEELKEEGVTYISADDMITPDSPAREFGLFHREPDGSLINIATPIWHWGKFYEQIIRQMGQSGMNSSETKGKIAVNYWWGMSAGVIDIICSKNLPQGTKRLITFLSQSIQSGSFHPFSTICSQDGICRCKEDQKLSPKEIVTMDWLADNVLGSVPKMQELTEEAKELVKLQGIDLGETEKKDTGAKPEG